VNADRFQPWASVAGAVFAGVLAVGSAYGAVALAETALTRAAYAGAVVGFGAHALVNGTRTRAHAAGDRDAAESLAGFEAVSTFCFLGAVVLATSVPAVEPSWRPLFFAPAALIVVVGLGGLVAGNRRVRERLGWEITE